MAKAKEDVYVEIGKMTAKKVDVDIKPAKLPAVMTKAAAGFFKKQSGFVTKATGKDAPGFKISGNVVSLKTKTKGKQELVMCTVRFVLSRLPGDKMIPGLLEGIGGTNVTKDLQGDAEFAVETATQKACETVVQQIKAATK